MDASLQHLNSDLQQISGTAAGIAQHTIAEAARYIDAADAVPQPFVQLPPLRLGFLGQPTTDGHDTQHDGAFSALGLHHF